MSINAGTDKVPIFDPENQLLDTRRYYLAKLGDQAAPTRAFRASWTHIDRRCAFEAT